MTDPINLNLERARREGMSSDRVSAEEILEEVLRRLRAGETSSKQMVIIWQEELDDDGRFRQKQMNSNTTIDSEIALLALAYKYAMDEWDNA